ncbi:type III-B CRISPR module RAMP protein Cmr6 [Chromatium weissei]|nr:type III-B CRISPR module RAMP protein Cmr6 [Chromatium weissei]
MILPLYSHDAPNSLPDGGHRGLWYNRFFNRYDANWEVRDNGKKDWIENNAKLTGNRNELEQNSLRHLALITALGGRGAVFSVDWNFATGLGLSHPVENGLAWHHTLGVPYLAGSGVKGLVKAWIEIWDESRFDEMKQQRIDAWFGNNEQAGAFIFFDALPIAPVNLTADIMTPHLGKWYEEGGEIEDWRREPDHIPADWHAPIPVPFLVAKKPKLLFGIAPRHPEFAAELNDVFAALKSALEWIGAGAKTAVGYGVMQHNSIETENLLQQLKKATRDAEINALSPTQQVLLKLRQQFENDYSRNIKPDAGGAFMAEVRRLLDDGTTWVMPERAELADLIEKIYTHAGWGSGDKKRERKERITQLRTP